MALRSAWLRKRRGGVTAAAGDAGFAAANRPLIDTQRVRRVGAWGVRRVGAWGVRRVGAWGVAGGGVTTRRGVKSAARG
eukprot:gene4746-18187_t